MIDHDRARAYRDILRRPAVLATIGMLSLALVFGGLLWATAQQSRTATASATSEPGVPSDAWSSLAPSPTGGVTAPAAIPILSARGMQGGVVPLETGFRLESVDGTSASALAKAISVEPAFDFTTQAEDGDRAVVLTPTEPLHPGYVYRFDLHGTSGALLETWAFQASQPLRVVGTLPEDGSAEVPTNTGIEVTFDQDGVTDAESHISIEPATKGRFEQHERTVVFVPDQLAEAGDDLHRDGQPRRHRRDHRRSERCRHPVPVRDRLDDRPDPCRGVRVAGRRRRVAGRGSAGACDVVRRR